AVPAVVRRPARARLEEGDGVGAEQRTALLVTLHGGRPVAGARVAFAVGLHREEVAEPGFGQRRVALRVLPEGDQLVGVGRDRGDDVPDDVLAADRRAGDRQLDPLVVDLADVDQVAARPPAGGRVGDADQRVTRGLVVEGEVEPDLAAPNRALEA